MQKRVTVVPTIPNPPKRERVAAYARVSTGKDAMLHSLAAQVDYYSRLILHGPFGQAKSNSDLTVSDGLACIAAI